MEYTMRFSSLKTVQEVSVRETPAYPKRCLGATGRRNWQPEPKLPQDTIGLSGPKAAITRQTCQEGAHALHHWTSQGPNTNRESVSFPGPLAYFQEALQTLCNQTEKFSSLANAAVAFFPLAWYATSRLQTDFVSSSRTSKLLCTTNHPNSASYLATFPKSTSSPKRLP